MTDCPVLDVGGTHVQACRVDTMTWTVLPHTVHRTRLDSNGSAEAIIGAMASCAQGLRLRPSETLAVAMPGPFDYAAGVGRFHGVGKFDALAGFDVRRALLARLAPPPRELAFMNDAEAFGLGEWLAGSARGHQRAVAITLGSGVGSAFVEAGNIVSSGSSVPPEGHVYRLLIRGRPLEEAVSRRAIVAAFRRAAPGAAGADLDVIDIAARALRGDEAAARLFSEAFYLLGTTLAPWLMRFGAEILVVGGGLTGAWPLIGAPLCSGLAETTCHVPVVRSGDTEAATAAGAAWHGTAGPSRRPRASQVRADLEDLGNGS